MKEFIHDLASELTAMSKVMRNDIKGYTKLCCIWIEHGSKTAVAYSTHISCALNIAAFCEEAGTDYNECIELVAGLAGLMPIQYANGYALVTRKNYDEFINRNGMPISEDGEWKRFEYINWKKMLPEMALCTQAVKQERFFDPKLLVILEKVKETNKLNALHRSVQERLVGKEGSNVFFAAYPEMVFSICAIPKNPEAMYSNPSNDMKDEYSFFKD